MLHPTYMGDLLVLFGGLPDLSGPLPGTGFQDSLVPVGGEHSLAHACHAGGGWQEVMLPSHGLLAALPAVFQF